MSAPESKRRLTLIPEPLTLTEQLRRKMAGDTVLAVAPDLDAGLREPFLAYLCKEFLDEDSSDTLNWAFEWAFSDELTDLKKHLQTLQSDAQLRRTYDVRGFHAKLFALFRTVALALEKRVAACIDVGGQCLDRFHIDKEEWSWKRHDMHPDEEKALCDVIPVARVFSRLFYQKLRQHRSWWNGFSLARATGMHASEADPLILALEVGLNGFLLYIKFLSDLDADARLLADAVAKFETVKRCIADHEEELARARNRQHAASAPSSKERVSSAVSARTTGNESGCKEWQAGATAAAIADVDYDSGIGVVPQINPATGLPMLDPVLDVHGNAFGTSNMDDMWSSDSGVGTLDSGYSSFSDSGVDFTAGSTGFGSFDDI
ncbi:hypothetical protein [Janthinobacterium sp. J1-1]|uniref:hypothetical protein n=1 Tax=Janthinobacterium sp. J1-1 TaxID=3065910 RepID=UPI002811E9F7|nr:hypothetical protein [Janthinobacterium sp. J1-1]